VNSELKAVVDLLATNKSGLPLSEIAERLGISKEDTSKRLKELEKESIVYGEGHSNGGRVLWLLDSELFDRLTSPRFAAKDRKCLRCTRMFMSAHAGNRICPSCDGVSDHGLTDTGADLRTYGRVAPTLKYRNDSEVAEFIEEFSTDDDDDDDNNEIEE
jgi:hypothetical protein